MKWAQKKRKKVTPPAGGYFTASCKHELFSLRATRAHNSKLKPEPDADMRHVICIPVTHDVIRSTRSKNALYSPLHLPLYAPVSIPHPPLEIPKGPFRSTGARVEEKMVLQSTVDKGFETVPPNNGEQAKGL